MRTISLIGGAVVAILAAAPWVVATTKAQTGGEKVIQIAVKKFEYIPPLVTLKKGEPVVLELTTLDRLHGFVLTALNVHADVPPKKTVQVRVVPDKVGTFEFACDIFCGTGHEGLRGTITVTE